MGTKAKGEIDIETETENTGTSKGNRDRISPIKHKQKELMGAITLIAAAAENNVLGKDNRLLWHLPDDFKRFKKITTGHPIIMGRKTFESFPKPLPNRIHIIVTRDAEFTTKFPDCIIVHSMEEALNRVKGEKAAFIIGGGEIYALGMEYADTIELTRVHHSFDGDTFFPELDMSLWKAITEEYHPKDERHSYDFTYLTYVRMEN